MKTNNTLSGLGIAAALAATTAASSFSASAQGGPGYGMMGGYGPGYGDSLGDGPGYGPPRERGPGYGPMHGYASDDEQGYGPGLPHAQFGWRLRPRHDGRLRPSRDDGLVAQSRHRSPNESLSSNPINNGDMQCSNES
jgi:hypothetical protein